MFLLISRNYKPDFEMMVEGVFSTRPQAAAFKEQCEEWKQESGIYNDEYYIIEMPLDPEPSQDQHYYQVEFYAPGGAFNVFPMSYNSSHWIQRPKIELNKVERYKNASIDKYYVTVAAKNAAEASAIGAPLIKKARWGADK